MVVCFFFDDFRKYMGDNLVFKMFLMGCIVFFNYVDYNIGNSNVSNGW